MAPRNAMNRAFFVLLTAGLTSTLAASACSTRASTDKMKTEYAAVSATLKPHSDGFSIDESPQASALLDRKWSLEAAWVIAYLNGHPSATEGQVKAAVSELDKGLESNVTLLDQGTYGIAIREGEIGNVFLAASDRKRFRVVWNAKDLRPSATKESKLLGAWSAESARGQCRTKEKEEGWLGCGPLFGSFGPLPNDEKGRHRFYIDGTYAELAGLSAAAQLSIWTWDGSTVRPQFADNYVYYIDQPEGTRAEGEFLRVRVRDQFRTFSTCCDDEGRPMDWNIRITPTGIEDLGKTAVVSELESIDELFYRAARAKPTEDIATAQAGTRARTLVRQMAKKNGIPSLGTLMYSNRKPAGSVTEFCFEADYSLLFTIKTVAGKPYLNSMKQLDYCPASGSPN